MSLTSHDFKAIYINRKSQETANALADHKSRVKDHESIQADVDAFLKRGGKIEEVLPSKNVSTAMHASPMAQSDNEYLRNTVANLRVSCGNNLDINPCPETGKYKAIYKGEQVGKLKKSVSQAQAAIRCAWLKERSNGKTVAKNERKQISKNKAKNNDSSED